MSESASLSEQYRRQREWRHWPRVFAELPLVQGQTVLDLGCGVGDQAAELTARGAQVIGIDADDELLAVARGRQLAGATFSNGDIARLPLDRTVDGIWSSFVAAYFPALVPLLQLWHGQLAPGGWIALTEIDDLFGHEPLAPESRTLLDEYAANAFAGGRYDFHMGRKLRRYLELAGFKPLCELTLEDDELAFRGPASAPVLEAWAERLARMRALRDFCGPRFEQVRQDFLACLASPEHRARAQVRCCIARRR